MDAREKKLKTVIEDSQKKMSELVDEKREVELKVDLLSTELKDAEFKEKKTIRQGAHEIEKWEEIIRRTKESNVLLEKELEQKQREMVLRREDFNIDQRVVRMRGVLKNLDSRQQEALRSR